MGKGDSQLMQTILIIVMVKKGRGSICTFTRVAVMRNTPKMTARLPTIRSFWGILEERTSQTYNLLSLM